MMAWLLVQLECLVAAGFHDIRQRLLANSRDDAKVEQHKNLVLSSVLH